MFFTSSLGATYKSLGTPRQICPNTPTPLTHKAALGNASKTKKASLTDSWAISETSQNGNPKTESQEKNGKKQKYIYNRGTSGNP